MALSTLTHLNFTGNAREALTFYQEVFGGHLVISTYGQGGVPRDSADSDTAEFEPVPADSPNADLVAFGMVAAENGFRIAAYDVFDATGGGLAGAALPGASTRVNALTHTQDLFVLLNGQSVEEMQDLWPRLGAGGTVIQALVSTPWAPVYGMLADRFGVTWVFGLSPA